MADKAISGTDSRKNDRPATDELRRLLDERGVEWTANDGEHVKETCWPYMGELTAAFAEYDNGTTRFACDTWCFTPEQAIAATLGGGTCHNVSTTGNFRCSECDAADLDFDKPSFCHGCGRRVIDVRQGD